MQLSASEICVSEYRPSGRLFCKSVTRLRILGSSSCHLFTLPLQIYKKQTGPSATYGRVSASLKLPTSIPPSINTIHNLSSSETSP